MLHSKAPYQRLARDISKRTGQSGLFIIFIIQDGLSAVHWAAIKGHKDILRYLIEEAPENNRADPTIAGSLFFLLAAAPHFKLFGLQTQCPVFNFLPVSCNLESLKVIYRFRDRSL